jgi:hypothetical protein
VPYFGVAYGKSDSIFGPSVGLLLGYFSQTNGERMNDTKLVTRSLYLESLQKEIAEKFEAGLRADEMRKKPLTLDERAEILINAAIRKLR